MIIVILKSHIQTILTLQAVTVAQPGISSIILVVKRAENHAPDKGGGGGGGGEKKLSTYYYLIFNPMYVIN